jgi:glycosyltransferase involved in cell wall biosynthesis
MRKHVPWRLRAPVRRGRNVLAGLRLALRELPARRAIARTPLRPEGLAVSYGVERIPGPDEVVEGGWVKFALLAEELPNSPRDFNVLYLGSSSIPSGSRALARLARRRGAAFVWNQNGVAYRGWHGPGWQRANREPARLLHAADHVLFQSAFCKLSADRFYGERAEAWEVLHNPVDTERFEPAARRPDRPLTLLLGGNQYQRYRFDAALDALGELPDARLLITGALSWGPEAEREGQELVAERSLGQRVELAGAYTRREAPDLFRRADVLLHTKYNDPCPSVVLEAMASGLPVVYSASGGVPELVGEDAGVGIPAPLDWERDHPPAAEALAAAVLEVAERLEERAEAARRRAVEDFDSRRWIARHWELFEELRAR